MTMKKKGLIYHKGRLNILSRKKIRKYKNVLFRGSKKELSLLKSSLEKQCIVRIERMTFSSHRTSDALKIIFTKKLTAEAEHFVRLSHAVVDTPLDALNSPDTSTETLAIQRGRFNNQTDQSLEALETTVQIEKNSSTVQVFAEISNQPSASGSKVSKTLTEQSANSSVVAVQLPKDNFGKSSEALASRIEEINSTLQVSTEMPDHPAVSCSKSKTSETLTEQSTNSSIAARLSTENVNKLSDVLETSTGETSVLQTEAYQLSNENCYQLPETSVPSKSDSPITFKQETDLEIFDQLSEPSETCMVDPLLPQIDEFIANNQSSKTVTETLETLEEKSEAESENFTFAHRFRQEISKQLPGALQEESASEASNFVLMGELNPGTSNFLEETLTEAVTVHTIDPLETVEETTAANSTPLLKLVKTVITTSSGRSKFSASLYESEEDPFESVELTEDEYIPSAESDSSCSSDYSDSEPPTRNEKFKTIKKRLFSAKDNVLSSDSLPRRLSLSASPVLQKESNNLKHTLKQTIAKIQIISGNAEILLLAPIHAGQYKVRLFHEISVNDNAGWRGYIFLRQNIEKHQCIPLKEEQIVCDATRNGNLLQCTFDVCCPENTIFKGKEKYVAVCEKFVTIFTAKVPADASSQETKMRRHSCLFCTKLVTCIGRHLQQIHKNEPEVKRVLTLSCSEKNKELRKLRLQGDKAYNEKVKMEKRIPVRKPVFQLISQSVECSNCKALIARRNFHKHDRRCSGRPAQRRKRVLQPRDDHTLFEEDRILKEIFSEMVDDEVGRVAKTDPTIKLLGIYLKKLNPKKHHLANTRSQLRRCARMLLAVKELDPTINELKDCICPQKYSILMEAIKKVCSFDGTKFENPSLALQFGPLLTHICDRLSVECLKTNTQIAEPKMKTLENFMALHKSEFKIDVTRGAFFEAKHKKFRNRSELPTPDDIKKMTNLMSRGVQENFEYLCKEEFDEEKWIMLGKSLLCQLLVFNRRRVGEASRILLSDYANRKKIDKSQHATMSRLEILLAEKYSVMYIIGKRQRMLPILINNEQIRQLDIYLKFRSAAGFEDSNPFLFASTCKTGYISASRTMTQFAKACGAEKPETLTGTKFRQQIATMSQILNLNDNELQQLCDFMGHERNVHNLHYRLTEIITQVTKWSRFFSVVGDVDVYKHKGKTLEELEPYIPPENYGENQSDEENEVAEGSASRGNNESDLIPVPEPEDVENTGIDESLPSSSQQEFTTPTKTKSSTAKHFTPNKKLHSSPTSRQLLNILEDPSNRIRNPASPYRRRLSVKYKWTNEEVELMKKVFAENFSNFTLPKMKMCARVLRENSNIFQACRTPHGLYAWIQYRVKTLKK